MTPVPLDNRVRVPLVACGVLAWAGVVLPVVVQEHLRAQAPPVWWVAVLAHQVAYLFHQYVSSRPHSRASVWVSGTALSVSAAAATMVWSARGLGPLLLVINVATLGFVLSRRWAVVHLLANAAFVSVVLPYQHLGWDWTISYYALMSFAAVAVGIAVREAHARRLTLEASADLEATNRRLHDANIELAQAQSRLARRSVDEERLRIARDLHDTLGHQLTALTLNLEVAAHLVEGGAAPHVAQSRELAKGILGDIRAVVARMRDGAADDPQPSRLADNDPTGLAEQVEVDDRLQALPPAVTGAVLRVLQECLVQAERHDGTVPGDNEPSKDAPSDGLSGMIERLRALGGTVHWATPAAGGLLLVAQLPLAEK